MAKWTVICLIVVIGLGGCGSGDSARLDQAVKIGEAIHVDGTPPPIRTTSTAKETRIDRDQLMLVPTRGNPWRFEEIDNTLWRRVPESSDQTTLVRQ